VKVLLWGKGRSGKGASRLLKKEGVPFYWGDDAEDPDLWKDLLPEVEVVVLSPGVPPSHPLWREALKAGKEVIGETELAWRFFKGKALAITGTDGKSTTTRLTYLMLKDLPLRVEEAGNVGRPFSEVVAEGKEGLAVLEISSFQGKTLSTFRPTGGAFVSFHPDHLDWHPSLKDYLHSKYRVFQNQREEDFVVLNDLLTEVKRTPTKARKLLLSRLKVGEWIEWAGKKLFKRSELSLRGEHNLLNAATASLIALEMGVHPERVREVIRSFKGLPYRLQKVGTVKGAEVYNDSKSTTPGALLTALRSFEGRVVLIAGGKDKGADFTPLREEVKKKVKLAVLIGEAKEKIAKSWEGAAPLKKVESLEEAVEEAVKALREGDYLLFSPGCASFDMFRNYEERGERFNRLIERYL